MKGNYDDVISSQIWRLDCHFMVMLETQRKIASKNLNKFDATIPQLFKKQMKRHILWGTLVIPFKGSKKHPMPLA